ncbi:armadillo-type protein [Dunaliella salina]|uniref:Armadillo-type protein n=1 Tax=Dunaliella salina TaxID=3046 RepID=A0ABQ7GFL2_DUNSA|nr:armadillo-type protein [Dunaliella salina]|eukprot:KAF5833400.1 armadillo-type protein [Dunaliella salina]
MHGYTHTHTHTHGHQNETKETHTHTLASLVVLVQQMEDNTPCGDGLANLAPTLIQQDLQPTADPHVQKNAIVLLTSLISLDAALWKQLVVEQNSLVPTLVSLLSAALSANPVDDTAVINLLSALAAVTQKGEEGARSVIDSQGQPVVNRACGVSASETSAQVQEAAADLICQMATYEGSVRDAMIEAGCVDALAALLAGDPTQCSEVHVRALLGLGMLTASNPRAQLQLASHANIKDLMAIIQHSPDADAKEVGKDLFKALARSEDSRNAMAEAMRSTVNASN